MISLFFRHRVCSERTLASACSLASALVAAAILVLGFLKLEQMDLPETGLFSAMLQVLASATGFVVLSVVCHVWRNRA